MQQTDWTSHCDLCRALVLSGVLGTLWWWASTGNCRLERELSGSGSFVNTGLVCPQWLRSRLLTIIWSWKMATMESRSRLGFLDPSGDADFGAETVRYGGETGAVGRDIYAKINRRSSVTSWQRTEEECIEIKGSLRPRRKKARRACFACQRAHLTCGQYLFTLS